MADNVTFENAAWGSRPEMLKLGHVEAKVALFPMLGGNIEIERLILEDMDLLVETNEAGVGNWVFGDQKKTGEADDEVGDLPVIEDLRIKNALLRYRDGETGERHVVMITHAEAGAGEAGGGYFFGHLQSPIRGEGSIFRNLTQIPDLLRNGLDIYVVLYNEEDTAYLYQIFETTVIPQEDFSLQSSPDSTITLVACVPAYIYDQRLLVTAKLVGIKG